jgi:hypothetical protein
MPTLGSRLLDGISNSVMPEQSLAWILTPRRRKRHEMIYSAKSPVASEQNSQIQHASEYRFASNLRVAWKAKSVVTF